MRVRNESEQFTPEAIAILEKYYKAKYICETCLHSIKSGWYNFPVAVFYTPEKHKEGSNYMGIFWDYRSFLEEDTKPRIMVTDAITAIGIDMAAVVAKNGDIIYSHYRHDYRGSDDGSVWIDGGRDYTRSGLYKDGIFVTLRIEHGSDELRIV